MLNALTKDPIPEKDEHKKVELNNQIANPLIFLSKAEVWFLKKRRLSFLRGPARQVHTTMDEMSGVYLHAYASSMHLTRPTVFW